MGQTYCFHLLLGLLGCLQPFSFFSSVLFLSMVSLVFWLFSLCTRIVCFQLFQSRLLSFLHLSTVFSMVSNVAWLFFLYILCIFQLL